MFFKSIIQAARRLDYLWNYRTWMVQGGGSWIHLAHARQEGHGYLEVVPLFDQYSSPNSCCRNKNCPSERQESRLWGQASRLPRARGVPVVPSAWSLWGGRITPQTRAWLGRTCPPPNPATFPGTAVALNSKEQPDQRSSNREGVCQTSRSSLESGDFS